MFPKVVFKTLKEIPEPYSIIYGQVKSPFGDCFLATLNDIVCCLRFISSLARSASTREKELVQRFGMASSIVQDSSYVQKFADKIFENHEEEGSIEVLLHGTEFQMTVCKALVAVPYGEQWSYTELAESINNPKAVRAVANVVASNEIAILIPCHRIVNKSGNKMKYRWGADKKLSLLDFESKN